MLVVSIKPRNEEELVQDFAKAKACADAVEIRLDDFCNVELLKKCIQEAPCMLTFPNPVSDDRVFAIAALSPKWLQIDWRSDQYLFTTLRERFPEMKVIAAYHDYEKTPDALDEIVEKLSTLGASMIKMVTFANSSLDALRMLGMLKNSSLPLTCFCMGEKGTFSRLVAPVFGSEISFASLEDKSTAPGQLTLNQMLEIYNFRTLNRETKLFALVGSPIIHSLSYKTHNAFFKKMDINALYVKITLEQEEFHSAYSTLKALGFCGLSVTRPLKNFSGPPINTIRFENGRDQFLNSDGLGMLEAIGEVAGKKMLIIGAGATGAAIAKEAAQRGACVMICNRTKEKAELLAKELDCQVVSWADMPYYDILVNATSAELDIEVRPGSVVADVIWPKKTPLLAKAEKQGCRIVTGYQMWKNQATHQFQFWFSNYANYEDLSIRRAWNSITSSFEIT